MSMDYLRLAVEGYKMAYAMNGTRLEQRSNDRYWRRMKLLHPHERLEFAKEVAALAGMGRLKRHGGTL